MTRGSPALKPSRRRSHANAQISCLRGKRAAVVLLAKPGRPQKRSGPCPLGGRDQTRSRGPEVRGQAGVRAAGAARPRRNGEAASGSSASATPPQRSHEDCLVRGEATREYAYTYTYARRCIGAAPGRPQPGGAITRAAPVPAAESAPRSLFRRRARWGVKPRAGNSKRR